MSGLNKYLITVVLKAFSVFEVVLKTPAWIIYNNKYNIYSVEMVIFKSVDVYVCIYK